MQLIIQKFGGSSLATKEKREIAVKHILQTKRDGYMPIVVVSAIGRRGDPYATDTLIDLAHNENSNPDERILAFLLSNGENLSAAVLALHLKAKNCSAVALTGSMAGIVTTENYLDAVIKRIKKDTLLKIVQKKCVVVISGFQGINEKGEITTLGRGGSDTTAVAMGAALSAKKVEIFTDVAGLMTADPLMVPQAKPIPKVSYSEILQMAHEGARVIHPKAVEIAMEFNVPVVIKNADNQDEKTIVSHYQGKKFGEVKDTRIITGITHINNLVQINATAVSAELEEKMFRKLAEEKISIDLINIFPDRKVFTVMANKAEETQEVLQNLEIKVLVIKNLSKVTLIGAGMRGVPGVMSKIISALKRSEIPILQTVDSHINISCLIEERYVEKAMCLLHHEFSLDIETV